MRNKNKIVQLVVLFTVIFLLLQQLGFVFVLSADTIIIISNKDVTVNTLSKSEIKSIFLGEMVMWDKNQVITFVILKTKAHEDFLHEYIGNTDAEYRNYWKKMVFTGKSRSPRSFKTAEELIDYVANTSGAIGYIPSEVYNEKVKIISVKRETN